VALLNERFRCAWKKVGTFTVLTEKGRIVGKQGGNVAAYFLTPDGRVLSATLGAVNPEYFLEEAKWALESTPSAAAHKARADEMEKNPRYLSFALR
jgi:hypothetical protein